MAWWEFLDQPFLKETSGVFITAGVVSVVLLAAGLGLAFAWHRWKDARRKRAKS